MKRELTGKFLVLPGGVRLAEVKDSPRACGCDACVFDGDCPDAEMSAIQEAQGVNCSRGDSHFEVIE